MAASKSDTKKAKRDAEPPRILILAASAGGGHVRAAGAIAEAAKTLYPDAVIENRDILEFASGVFRKMYTKTYSEMVDKAPFLWSFFYDHLDNDSQGTNNVGDKLRKVVEKLNFLGFEQWLTSQEWDVIINTHFLPAELIAQLKLKEKIKTPQVTVCTDFDTHRIWVNEPCDHYFVATEEGKLHLQHWDIPAKKIDVTGIPIMPAFSKPVRRDACCKRLGIVGDRPIVLQMCGGGGMGPVEEVFESIVHLTTPIDLVVICGKNEGLKKRLEELKTPAKHRVHIIGYTDDMDSWMGCADVAVTKPGGLTTSEGLARGVAMIVVNPIPGQEFCNSDYLLENGAALKANHPSALRYKLDQLLADGARLKRMQTAAKALARPQAAFEVVEKALKVARR